MTTPLRPFQGQFVVRRLGLAMINMHTNFEAVHHSSTYMCMPNFIEIEETFCGRTVVRTHVRGLGTNGRTDGYLRPAIRSTLSKSRPNNTHYISRGVGVRKVYFQAVKVTFKVTQVHWQ